jgi:hypothetical protein
VYVWSHVCELGGYELSLGWKRACELYFSCYEYSHVLELRSLGLSDLLRIPLGFTGPLVLQFREALLLTRPFGSSEDLSGLHTLTG